MILTLHFLLLSRNPTLISPVITGEYCVIIPVLLYTQDPDSSLSSVTHTYIPLGCGFMRIVSYNSILIEYQSY